MAFVPEFSALVAFLVYYTLPQNKLDALMEFFGFPALGGVFLLYPAPFGAGAPVQW